MTTATIDSALNPRCFTPAYYSMPASPVSLEAPADGMSSSTLQGQPLPDKVFVGGLSEKTTESDLRELFNDYAEVKTVKIITDKAITSKSGEPRRYAFVEFYSVGDAKKVLSQFLPENRDDTPNIELHGRRLNIGCAFKKTPTFGRVFGPTGMSPIMTDPYGLYAAQCQQYMQAQQKSPMMSPQYFPYYGGIPMMSSPFMYQQASSGPASPTMTPTNVAGQQRGYSMSNGPSGMTSPQCSPMAPPPSPMTTNMAYQLANSMLQQMSLQSSSADADTSYLNSSSNSGSSRNGGSDRSMDRFPYGPQLPQLPSGHMDQRERGGRMLNIPGPVRLGTAPQSPTSPYMNGGELGAYMTSTPGMRHAFAQN